MINYTTRYLNIISLIITIIIFLPLNSSILKNQKINFKSTSINNFFRKNIIQVEMNSNNINKETEEKEKYESENKNQNNPNSINTKEETWKLIIPSISLEATIAESTSEETMNKYIGHFEETSKLKGNIGLAAHNRGYENNYFSNLKKIKIGDEIIYKYNQTEIKYIVDKHVIIKDTDWSYLEDTEENKITLITCIENEPEYRRCVQGIEKQLNN